MLRDRALGYDHLVFEGFTLDSVDVGEVILHVRHGGQGPPVVLVHGHPRQHGMEWPPLLAGSFFVVCPDLRGYGQSTLPPEVPEHAKSSKAGDGR